MGSLEGANVCLCANQLSQGVTVIINCHCVDFGTNAVILLVAVGHADDRHVM